jgi:hypothetical protein
MKFPETETHDMKPHTRALTCGAALLAAIVMIACGGKQTLASKSAAAYDEAKKKGIPIAFGEHGGHSAEAGAEATAPEHAAMPNMDHSSMAGMDHMKMPGMKHDSPAAVAHDMAGMHHSTQSHDMAGMSHDAMPGMTHGSMPASAIVIAPPPTTLGPDEFDAPAPTSIEEAAKASSPPNAPPTHHHHGGAS